MSPNAMKAALRFALISVAAPFLLFCSGGSTPTTPVQQGDNAVTLDGPWGGSHIQMIVEGTSVRIELDCAHATLSRPSPDAHGAFSVSGSYVQEHGGPVRVGEEEKGVAAEFRGSVSGDTMSLQIVPSDTKEVIGPFTLKHNEQGRLMKCL